MRETNIKGVYRKGKKLFTKNLDDSSFRSWNPYHSKFSVLILKKINIDIRTDFNVLYLGASTGTTVSHFSDILLDGHVFAVESSAVSMNKFLELCENRKNIIPILEDAFHPDRYQFIVPKVDFIYQDISQRNQSEIFIENLNLYLKEDMKSILMVKAKNIDISLKPKDAYDKVCSDLKNANLEIENVIELSPYDRDHAAIIVKK